MENSFIEGYGEIVNYYGYWPSFHDDLINRIEITSNDIIFYISLQSSHKKKDGFSRLKITFSEIKYFYIEGEMYGCISIILDIEFQIVDGNIETQVTSSLGARGIIHSGRVKIEFE